jgi:hypothetical protein
MPGRADAVEWKAGSFLLNSLKSALWRSIWPALIAFSVAVLNPFEIKTWEEMRSHEVWERMHAPLVAGSDLNGRDAITIVSINEETLARTGFKRPFDMAMHGEILSDIIEAPRAAAIEQASRAARGKGTAPQPVSPSLPPAKLPGTPKAVFIDLVLSGASAPDLDAPVVARTLDERSTACQAGQGAQSVIAHFSGPKSFLCYARTVAAYTRYADWKDDRTCQSDTLSKIACIQRYGGIPILFADESPGRATGAIDTRSPAMRLLDEIAVAVPVFISLPEYPLTERSEGGATGERRVDPPSDAERIRLTPALALYAIYCRTSGEPAKHCPASMDAVHGGGPNLSSGFRDSLDLEWATGGPPDNFIAVLRKLHPDALEKGCSADRGGWAALKRFAERLAAGIHLAHIEPDCAYTHDLPYQDIPSPGFQMQDAVATLGGKLVLVGEEFRDSVDVVKAAPNSALPGVFAHAMALDRLIVDQEKYRRPPVRYVDWLDFNNVDAGIVLTVFLFFAIDRILGLWIGFPRHSGEHGGRLDREAEHRSHRLWPWVRLSARLLFPFVLAFGVWVVCRRQFEQSVVAVGGLAFAMFSEIAIASLIRWADRRQARFVRLFQDIRRLFAPAPERQAHHNGDQP